MSTTTESEEYSRAKRIAIAITKPRQKVVKGWDIGFQIGNWTFGFWFDSLRARKGIRGGIHLGPLTIEYWD